MEISLRPATWDDYDFLLALREAAMRPHVEAQFGIWDAVYQNERFRQYFDPITRQVIVVDGADAGMLALEERAEEVFLSAIYLLPAYQKRGIGTRLLRQIIARAEEAGKPVALRVLKANRRARSLYQRLGFGVTGETDAHYVMARYPKKGYN